MIKTFEHWITEKEQSSAKIIMDELTSSIFNKEMKPIIERNIPSSIGIFNNINNKIAYSNIFKRDFINPTLKRDWHINTGNEDSFFITIPIHVDTPIGFSISNDDDPENVRILENTFKKITPIGKSIANSLQETQFCKKYLIDVDFMGVHSLRKLRTLMLFAPEDMIPKKERFVSNIGLSFRFLVKSNYSKQLVKKS